MPDRVVGRSPIERRAFERRVTAMRPWKRHLGFTAGRKSSVSGPVRGAPETDDLGGSLSVRAKALERESKVL